VIESGKYDLYEGEYEDVLKIENDNGCESILETQVTKVFDMNLMQTEARRFSYIHTYTGWRGRSFDETNKNPAYADLNLTMAYGNFNPKKSLYDAFVAREGVDGYRLNQTMKTYDFVKNEIGVTVSAPLYGHEGYFMWKNRFLTSELIMNVGMPYLNKVNVHIMRYAEVLLLAAEAHFRNGNTSKATEYVNKIRSRAKLADLGTVTMDDIKIEKRLELCLENVRYQDIIRWGDTPSLLAEQGKTIPEFNLDGTVTWPYTNTTYGFKTGQHELLPIPGEERALNPNMDQNPGW
jgi:hypothetical protein